MSKITTTTCLLITLLRLSAAHAQESLSSTANQSAPAPTPPFQTPITGWKIQAGDTLQLGRGSRSDKTFAFIYHGDSLATASAVHPLPLDHAGQRLLVRQLSGTQPGIAQVALLGETASRKAAIYQADLSKAINAGELLPPVQYRPSAQASPSLPVVAAQQLINLKALLDKGKISRAEYERRRQKIQQKR